MTALRPRELTLAKLLAEENGPISLWRLVRVMRVDDDVLRVHICRLRSKLGRDAVRSVRCVGYELTAEGRRALASMGATP